MEEQEIGRISKRTREEVMKEKGMEEEEDGKRN